MQTRLQGQICTFTLTPTPMQGWRPNHLAIRPHSPARVVTKRTQTRTHLTRHAHLRGFVIGILRSHSALFFRLGCRSLRKPLWVLEQVNFGANFKIFDEIVEKVFVVLGLAVLSLEDTPPWSHSHDKKMQQSKTTTHTLRCKPLHFGVQALELKRATANGFFVHWSGGGQR
jgi:hypothetical protein